jgi:hypothetical protein
MSNNEAVWATYTDRLAHSTQFWPVLDELIVELNRRRRIKRNYNAVLSEMRATFYFIPGTPDNVWLQELYAHPHSSTNIAVADDGLA